MTDLNTQKLICYNNNIATTCTYKKSFIFYYYNLNIKKPLHYNASFTQMYFVMRNTGKTMTIYFKRS